MSWLLQPLHEAFSLVLFVFLYMFLQLILMALLPKQKLISTIFFFLMVLLVLQYVVEAFLLMKQITTIFSAFFLAFIPIVTTMLGVLQSVLSFITWTPAIVFIIQILVHVCDVWLIPALMVSLIFDLCSRAFPDISFSRLADLIRKSLLSVIAATILSLTSLLTFSGLSWFALKESMVTPIKKVIEQNIPLIGSLLVEGVSLLKNFQMAATTVVGLVSITSMLTLAFTPALLLLIKAFTLKLIGAITEPFMDKTTSQMLDDFGQGLLLLCGIALLLAIGFIAIWMLLFILVQIGTGKLL